MNPRPRSSFFRPGRPAFPVRGRVLPVILLLLVLVNGVLFLWGQGWLGNAADGREPDRPNFQVSPEKLQILSTEAARPAEPVERCQVVDGLAAADGEKLQARLTTHLPGLKLTWSAIEEPARIDVGIAPLASQSAADTKVAELRKLGFRGSASVVAADGAFRIVLGHFREEKAALDFLKELADKSIKSAHVIDRQPVRTRGSLELRGPEALLAGVGDDLKDYPAARLQPCPGK